MIANKTIDLTRFCGVDFGKKGAIAFFDSNGALLEVKDMPLTGKEINVNVLNKILKRLNPETVFFVEKPEYTTKTQPLHNSYMSYHFGINLGLALAIIRLNKFKVINIFPMQWKSHFGLVNMGKNESCIVACKLYPNLSDWFITLKLVGGSVRAKQVFYDDRADAVLVGLYGIKTYTEIV